MTKKSILSKDLLPIIETTLDAGGSFDLTVSGTSMRPFLTHKKTTVTLIKPICYKRYKVYLFKSNNTVYLHRLIAIDGETFIFQGDALKQKEHCSLKDIIAQVDTIKKNGKKVSQESIFYQFKLRVWAVLKPFRRLLLKLCK